MIKSGYAPVNESAGEIYTNPVKYKGYKIILDKTGKFFNVLDSHGELEDHGFKSTQDAKNFIDGLAMNESYESECSEVEYKGSTYLVHEGEIRAIAKGHKHLVYNGAKCLGIGKVIRREDIRNGKEITYELDNGSTISVQYRNNETVSYIYKKLK